MIKKLLGLINRKKYQRVQILDYINNTSKEIEVKEEGFLIKFATHTTGRDSYISSYDVALVKLDNGYIKAIRIDMIRFIS